MKTFVLGTVILTGLVVIPALAQDKLPREQALKYALVASGNLKEMLNTPIPTDPDVKRVVVVRDGDYGGMLLPEAKLSAAGCARAKATSSFTVRSGTGSPPCASCSRATEARWC